MENTRQSRVLEIFFRGLRGEDLSVQQLADEYNVSTKSITRSINDLKAFLADHRELVGNTELLYSHQAKCYRLYMDEFLSSKELFALLEVMIGARAFSRIELLALTDKLKRFTTPDDRQKLQDLIQKELYHYTEVKHDCDSVLEYLWQLANCITNIADSDTIIEIKSIISQDDRAVFPTVYSERTQKQFHQLDELLSEGIPVYFFIVSLSPYVKEIVIDPSTPFYQEFCKCMNHGMRATAFSCRLVNGTPLIDKEIPIHH